MADKSVALDNSNPLPFKAHDNSDGSYALATAATSSAFYDGTVAAAAAAAQLQAGSQPCAEVIVQNDPSNAVGQDIYVGNSTSQSMRLKPGDSEIVPINDVNKVYVKAVTGTPRVNWHARS